jgi:hypothetical protein
MKRIVLLTTLLVVLVAASSVQAGKAHDYYNSPLLAAEHDAVVSHLIERLENRGYNLTSTEVMPYQFFVDPTLSGETYEWGYVKYVLNHRASDLVFQVDYAIIYVYIDHVCIDGDYVGYSVGWFDVDYFTAY